MKLVSFDTTKQDLKLIVRIVDRAQNLGIVAQPKKGRHREDRYDYKRIDCIMDITACHANGCELNLTKLIEADDFNFKHDVVGIANHIDRNTGHLGKCFSPRFAA